MESTTHEEGHGLQTPQYEFIDSKELGKRWALPESWIGEQAFRRGLATNLHRLGVQDEIIQRILRHPNVGVTQKCYIKAVDADVVAAMRSLENAPNMHLESVKSSQRM